MVTINRLAVLIGISEKLQCKMSDGSTRLIQSNATPLRLVKRSAPHARVIKMKISHANKLTFYCQKKHYFLSFSDILYCQADGNYVHVHSTDARHWVISKTLKDVEAQLSSARFVRCHQSYLINVQFVSLLMRDTVELEFQSRQLVLPVSRRKFRRLKAMLIYG